ncbi:MAG: hypothetical protein ACOX61_08300 [Brooklawnia sp.]|jgi:hypothetical protein
MRQAGLILDFTPELAARVVAYTRGASALVLAADGRRENGRWKRGSVHITDSRDSGSSTWTDALRQAGLILDYTPELAARVVAYTRGASALVLTADGRRSNGRWAYGRVTENPDIGKSMQNALTQAGTILDYTPDS